MGFVRRMSALALAVGLVAACGSDDSSGSSSADPAKADEIMRVVRETMEDAHLKSVIVKASVDGDVVVEEAVGESMSGVSAGTDMHFRNGSVAMSYVATLLLVLVDEGVVSLDDKVSEWLPDLSNGDRVTLGQLAQMTSGYRDYVLGNAEFNAELDANPFRQWTPEELISYPVSQPLLYDPGTNWNYAHTNYVILGLALEKITGTPLAEALQEKVLGPMGLDQTTDPGTPAIADPALHAFTSERRDALKIPQEVRFYEESTYWNPSWTMARGAIQTTDIDDMHASAIAVGNGDLLTAESYLQMVTRNLIGKTTTLDGCATCFAQSDEYAYGLGIVSTGDWLIQNPFFSGESGVMAYLPSDKVAIAVAITYGEEAFDGSGNTSNKAEDLFQKIGAVLAPEQAPPTPQG
jgi:CubicO group peptidase (beta-lactamase class C family)